VSSTPPSASATPTSSSPRSSCGGSPGEIYAFVYMDPSPDQFVRDLRARAGLTQQALALRAGMAQSAVSAYESGRKVPSLATLDRLVTAAGDELVLSTTRVRRRPTVASLRRRRRAIVAVCAAHGASSPRVFGSVARGEARPDSDVDLLVDLEPGRTLFDVAALHDDLTDLLGWSVDVVTLGALRGSLAHVADEALPV
jgi:uncharacterized protein